MIERSDNPQNNSYTEVFSVFIVLCIIYIASLSGFLNPLSSLLQRGIVPISQTFREIWQMGKNEYATLLQARSLRNQVDLLTEENTKLKADLSELVMMKEENKQLFSQLQNQSTTLFSTKVGKIISTSPELTLFVEDPNGVAVGQFVTLNKNVIGLIESIAGNYARVTLLKDLKAGINVSIINPAKKEYIGRGVLSGEFGTNIVISQITQDLKLERGYQVVINQNQYTQENIHIGTIETIIKRESDLFQKVYVKQDVDYASEIVLFIVVPKK